MDAVAEPVSNDAPAAQGELRVCHIIDTLKFGGAERQFVNILNAMPITAKCAVILRDQGEAGFHAQLHGDIPTLSMRMSLRYSPFQIWTIVRWLRRQRINVVHTHMFWPSLYGTVAARLAGVPAVVTTEHGTAAWKKNLHHWLDGQVIGRAADVRFCVSTSVAQVLREMSRVPAHKLALVTNGTDVPEPVEIEPRATVHIGTLGRMVWQKDFHTLLEAAELLRQRGTDFRLTILGDGPLRTELEHLTSERGLGDHVDMPGFQHDVDGWLRRFDIFVMSSVDEGQPVALLEAMARGLPVVSTRVGGIPDTVQDGVEGRLVDARNPAQLAEALASVANRIDLRRELGRRARARVQRDFSSDALARRYLDVYLKLLRDKRGMESFSETRSGIGSVDIGE